MNALDVSPHSSTEVLRARTILLIELQDVDFGPWEPEPDSALMVRDVKMNVVILDIIKGAVSQAVGIPFEHSVKQRGTGDVLVTDYYGLWSHVELAPAARFVAFCIGASDNATELLTDSNCEQLLPDTQALADTCAAMELEAQHLSPIELIARAADLSKRHGDIFARYVSAKAKPATQPLAAAARTGLATTAEPSQNGAFEALMAILEAPQTNEAARQTYLVSVYEELGMAAAPERTRELRLIRAMLRILALPEAQTLHSPIIDVYLPNILHLNDPQPTFSANDVIGNDEEGRRAAVAVLKEMPAGDAVARIIQWLER